MKNSKLVLMLMLMSMYVWSCKDDNKEVAVQKVTVQPTTVSLEPNTTQAVVATVVPSDANQEVKWTSEDKTIATVSEGVITAVAVGTTQVIATSVADPSKSAAVTVAVTRSVSSIAVSEKEVALTIGDERRIEATVLPSDAHQEVAWTSKDETIATVSAEGVITAVAVGTTKVIATSVAAPSKSDTVTVEVTPSVSSIAVSETEVALTVGDERRIEATVYPEVALNKEVEWESGNSAIATVDAAGLIVAQAVGSTTVTVTSVADPSKSATVTVTVAPPVSSITVNEPLLELPVGDQRRIEATVLPAAALNKEVTWESGNAAIATVDAAGMIKAEAVGSTTVTVTSVADRTKFATVNVTVLPVPRLIAPADGAAINAQGYVFPISFSWETIDGATSYSLRISNSPAFPPEASMTLAADIAGSSVELFNAKDFNDLLEANGVAPETSATFYLKVVADNGRESPASSVVITRDKRIVYYYLHSIGTWSNVGGYYMLPTVGNIHHWTARLAEAFPSSGYSKAVWAFDYKSEFTVGFFLYARECTSPWWNAIMNGGNSYMPPNSQNQWEHWEADIKPAIDAWGFGKVNDFLDIQLGEDPDGLAGLYIKAFAFILYE
ncbi:MAG: Ig-like domain-containing protein [Dysgonamonadaceae bacterium]|jgi:uncharacterized protein YjdB|nr:Ig-like domain-containing protein [Dysgonamonadaceae bacterium]